MAEMTPQQRAENIARTYLSPYYGHKDAIEAIRVAQIENANVELEKRRQAEAVYESLKTALWPGKPRWVQTKENPQQDFHEAVAESLRACSMCAGDGSAMEPDKDCICGGAQTRQAELQGLNACIQHWREGYDNQVHKRTVAETSLAEHLTHVQRFLAEFWAVMVDPLEDATGTVKDTCTTLLITAVRHRQTLYDNAPRVSALESVVAQLKQELAAVKHG